MPLKPAFLSLSILLFACTACAGDLEDTIELYKQRKYDEARERLQKLEASADEHTRNQAILYHLKSYLVEHNFADFDGARAKVLAQFPDYPPAGQIEYFNGYFSEEAHEWTRAIAAYERFLAANPKSKLSKEVEQHVARCKSMQEPSLANPTAYGNWLIALAQANLMRDIETSSPQFLEKYPKDANAPTVMFNYVLALRASQKWEQARSVANRLKADYSASTQSLTLGGIDGKTEDQAAYRFAEIVDAYGKKDFKKCCDRVVGFQNEFPENWRVAEAWKYYCYSVYHAQDQSRFFEISEKLLQEHIDPSSEDKILYLQASFLTQQARGEDARKVIKTIKAKYPKSGLIKTEQLDQLTLETYLFGRNSQSIRPDTDGLPRLLTLFDRRFNRSVKHPTWFIKNARMGLDLYSRIARRAAYEPYILKALQNTVTSSSLHLSALGLAVEYYSKGGDATAVLPFAHAALDACHDCPERKELLGLTAALERRAGNKGSADKLNRERNDSNWSLH